MDHKGLKEWSKKAADWAHDYHKGLRERPVRATLEPGSLRDQLPTSAPEQAEAMEIIWEDFTSLVPDAMTHWQHPRFFAYFPANAAPVSMLAEQLVNAMASNALIWQTAPAATEVEQAMMVWLRKALGLPDAFTGTIHDSATTATLSAILTMREAALEWKGLYEGLSGQPRMRIYASGETHSSIDKAVRVAGIGQDNLVKIPVDDDLSMRPDLLAQAIKDDRAAGYLPIGIVLCAGGTSVGAFDKMKECIAIAREEDLPTHIDAAWAGSAMICPEFRELWDGAEGADSIIFNPHKWLGAQFDCAVQFMRNPVDQVRTLGLRPTYLETLGTSEVTNFNEWTVPLGRRFRALKIWFLLRAHGLEDLRQRIRNHVAWANELYGKIAQLPGVEMTTPPHLSLFSFALDAGDVATEKLLQKINDDGRIYLTQTHHKGRLVIRVQVGQFDCTRDDVMMVETVLKEFLT
jgi:aromatic-L-amino-acid decarboxylase